MKGRRFKGFTLVETVIGFVLISFIVVMVGTVITSMYMMSSKLKELPNAYYGAQNLAETELDELSSYVKEKYRLQNEINNTPPEDLDASVRRRLEEVNNKLAEYTMEEFELFGKDLEVYKFVADYPSTGSKSLTLHAGVVNAERLERLVPIVDKVTISGEGAAGSNEMYYNARVAKVSSVDYNSKNIGYKYRESYQWYLCTGGFHTTMYADGEHPEKESQYADTVYAMYPTNFTILSGETKNKIEIKDEYYGKMLVCVVTPLSINGAYGKSVVSNHLYVSALPKLANGSYRMLIDVSMTTFDFDESDQISLPSIQSRLPTNCKLVSQGGGEPYVDLNGAATDTDEESAPTEQGTYSRFISFSNDTMMRTDGSFSSSGDTRVFVVAKNKTGRDVDFISAGNSSAGFATCYKKTSGAGDTGWQIVEAALPKNCRSFAVGGCDVDVAELIVVSKASTADQNNIWRYLSEKYRIERN